MIGYDPVNVRVQYALMYFYVIIEDLHRHNDIIMLFTRELLLPARQVYSFDILGDL